MAKKPDLYRATLRDMLALEVPWNVRVSADGSKVAFAVQTTNWKDNRYESHCHLYDNVTGTTRPLTRYGDVRQMEWMDGETLALLRAHDEKAQIWLFEGAVGEGWQITDHKTGVEWFHPLPAGNGFFFLARQPEKDEKKNRTDRYGKYTHFEQEASASAGVSHRDGYDPCGRPLFMKR